MIYRDILDIAALEQYAAALNSRAQQAGAGGRLSASSLRDRILASGGRCEWCATCLVEREFELDHIISLKHNGVHSPENLVLACPDCNRRKGQKHPARFAAEIFSRTRCRTPLLDRVMRHFALEPGGQLPLFAAQPSQRRDINTAD